MWEYQTRPADLKSTLQILKVERMHGAETAIHIQVNGLNLKPRRGEGIMTPTYISYFLQLLEAGVIQLIAVKEPLSASFEDGYEM